MTRRTFFCERIDRGEKLIALSREVSHHVAKVHRYRPGDLVELVDGKGGRWTARIDGISKAEGIVTVTLIEQSSLSNESPLNLLLLCAFARADKMDLVVRQATELGVKALIFFQATMSVSTIDLERITSKVDRWKKIAREALCQCGRSYEPAILCVNSLAEAVHCVKEFVERWDEALRIVAYEKERNALLTDLSSKYRNIREVCGCVGPESGWSRSELDYLKNDGFLTVSLGPRILRYETACVLLAGMCQFLWGDMGKRSAT